MTTFPIGLPADVRMPTVPLPGFLQRPLGSTTLDPEAFRRLADFLARVADDGRRRVTQRRGIVAEAASTAASTDISWKGPDAVAFREAFAVAATSVGGADPAVDDAYRALAELAGVAARTAKVIAEVEVHERTLVTQATDRLHEIHTRSLLNVADTLGIVPDDQAESARRAYDDLNRARAEASEQRRETLLLWERACGVAAAALHRARVTVAAIDPAAPDHAAAIRQPEQRYHPDAAKEHVQNRWIDTQVVRFLDQHKDDPAAIAAYWAGLSPAEKDALMARRPDLVATVFWPHLNEDDRRAFRRADNFARRETELEVSGDLTWTADGVTFDLDGKVTIKATVNNDGTVDAQLLVAIGFGAGPGGPNLSAAFGGELKDGVSIRFADEPTFQAAFAELRAALEKDRDRLQLSFPETKRVIRDVFGANEHGFDLAHGARAEVEGDWGVGLNELELEGRLSAGGFYDGLNRQRGIYLKGEVTLSGQNTYGKGEVKGETEAKLYRTDDGRNFAKVTVKTEASMTSRMLSGLGIALPELDPLPGGATASTTVSITVEGSEANQARVRKVIDDIRAGKVSSDLLRELGEGAEISVAFGAGTKHQQDLVPSNPVLDAEVSGKDVTTIRSIRKTPSGEFYVQGAR